MKEKIIIEGSRRLEGELVIGGAKNSVLKIMAAAILVDDVCEIYNVPNLTDVDVMIQVINHLGAKTKYSKKDKKLIIDARNVSCTEAPYELVSKMRASFNILGALISRFNEAKVPLPGGCNIGERRVNLHIKGLESLGVDVKIESGYVVANTTNLKGADIYLDRPSVGATENIMMAAVLADGSTVINNAAQEPEIIDLANFLNSIGADINGAGTSEIVINGVKQKDLHSSEYTTIPDRMEAGTYIAAVAATRGHAIIKNVFPTHLTSVNSKFAEMGIDIKIIDPFSIEVISPDEIKAVDVVTQPHPGFPTDMQSPVMSLLATASGVSVITESIYENRFMNIGELRRMGADVQQEGSRAIIKGVDSLTGAPLSASDLRAGASLMIAALSANGSSSIDNIYHIDRGYENFEEKLLGLGAKIKRVKIDQVEQEIVPIEKKVR